MTNKLTWIDDELEDLKNQGLYNTIKTISTPVGPHIKVNGRELLNFCSNNYLGLANHPKLIEGAMKALNEYGVGPAAVRTIAGTSDLHIKLEEKLAKFKKAESVITFQSGFVANLAAIPALVGENDIIFSDELNHASIIDACRLSRAEVIRYKHLDTADLEVKISERKGIHSKKLIVTDGVFSMDGDIAPLPGIVKISEKYNCMTMVDDAHGEGVLGQNGRGIVDHFNLHGKIDVEIGTLSKAFGVVGGFAAGNKSTIDWLRQRGRPNLFSSAMTFPDVGAAIAAVDLLENSKDLVERLWQNAKLLKSELLSFGFNTGNSQTPIIPVIIGDEKQTQKVSEMLFDGGVFAVAIKYPTVTKGTARIRLIVSASHSGEDIEKASALFKKISKLIN